jgi:hypothetical protein
MILVLAVHTLAVVGCGASAQGVANRANALRSYDSRLLSPATAVPSDDAEPVLDLRLTTRFAIAPASVQSLIRVSPHPDNRLLRVLIDGEAYARSSDTQLDGEAAAQHFFFTWRSLPPGTYTIIAIVYGQHGVRGQRVGNLEVRGERSGGR